MKRILCFGTFDPLHEGHRDFFRQARALGDQLTVVIARDAVVRAEKGREPAQDEVARLAAVTEVPEVDHAQLGDKEPGTYGLLAALSFEVLALGYDQRPDDARVAALLKEAGKPEVVIVRLESHYPEQYKSSYLRKPK